MFPLSMALGFVALLLRVLQAAGSAQLYSHPGPVRAIVKMARSHADEYVVFGDVSER